MDLWSITGACVSSLGSTAKALIAITSYVATYRDTRSDLFAVKREIGDYEMIIEFLREDEELVSGRSPGPKSVTEQISQIIKASEPTFTELANLLEKHQKQGASQSAWWLITGKEQVLRFQSIIAAHRGTLTLALDVSHRFGPALCPDIWFTSLFS